jgi:type I restriction-modification system DNA methylase subunit
VANSSQNSSDLDYADTLWKAADALRGQVDAAEYKHVVLGLLFLKYISDSFESRRDALRAELTADGITGKQLDALLESRDEYTAERVFWVPPESRWPNLQNQATCPDIATLIDDAILAVERDNPNLKGKLPRDYARRGIQWSVAHLCPEASSEFIFGDLHAPTLSDEHVDGREMAETPLVRALANWTGALVERLAKGNEDSTANHYPREDR